MKIESQIDASLLTMEDTPVELWSVIHLRGLRGKGKKTPLYKNYEGFVFLVMVKSPST